MGNQIKFAEQCGVMAAARGRILRRPGSARRNLFGPVDREQLQEEYRAALRRDLEEASERWGFDFTAGRPRQGGRFQWERVPDARVPPLYRSWGQRAAGPGRLEPAESDKENTPGTPGLEDMERTPERGEDTGLKRKQTNITDFYQAKRRVVWLPRKSGE
ncbi:cyclin-dependent kinase inhibitor 1 isoform X1 [Kryptolebias marmoratus]|uniref:Cyclin dependent kinase inhibitor 1A n=2 Tax=Kryptolebias marmoratus TaxID=37003 RepID=A0A3Q3BQS5_KRYMA|nr:cyclin-dependent kinase inhibitor 1 isoform X1 [Kryptolebias marmoratus]